MNTNTTPPPANPRIQNTNSHNPRSAFTLIELLSVIAIIGVLAAIIIPVVGKVRTTAATTKCLANLRTWGNATALYVGDNKGKLPGSAYVQGATINGVYFGGLAQDAYLHLNRYVLPANHPGATWGYSQADLENYTCTTRTDAGHNLTWAAYGFNDAPSARSMNTITDPSRLIWATETAGGGGGMRWISNGMLVPSNLNLGATTTKPHGDKNNILYLDGHVGTQALRDLVKADFTRGTASYNATDDTARIAN